MIVLSISAVFVRIRRDFELNEGLAGASSDGPLSARGSSADMGDRFWHSSQEGEI